MQEIQDQSLDQEDFSCCRETKSMDHSYGACALEPGSHNYRAHGLRMLRPVCLEPGLSNKGSHGNKSVNPLATTREKPT